MPSKLLNLFLHATTDSLSGRSRELANDLAEAKNLPGLPATTQSEPEPEWSSFFVLRAMPVDFGLDHMLHRSGRDQRKTRRSMMQTVALRYKNFTRFSCHSLVRGTTTPAAARRRRLRHGQCLQTRDREVESPKQRGLCRSFKVGARARGYSKRFWSAREAFQLVKCSHRIRRSSHQRPHFYICVLHQRDLNLSSRGTSPFGDRRQPTEMDVSTKQLVQAFELLSRVNHDSIMIRLTPRP